MRTFRYLPPYYEKRSEDAASVGQILAAFACLAVAANLQYTWPLFVGQIERAHGWSEGVVQRTWFATFILWQTLPLFVWGFFIDKVSPRPVIVLGGFLLGASWVLNAYAHTLGLLHASAVMGGLGVGMVAAATYGNIPKWKSRRGFASGWTAAGYGIAISATVIPISYSIQAIGYERAYLVWGLGQGLAVMALGLLIRSPEHAQSPKQSFGEMLRQFRDPVRIGVLAVLYVMFTLVAFGGLVMLAKLKGVANDYGTVYMLKPAVFVVGLCSGFSRPLFGMWSDRLGRERVMARAFFLEALGIACFAFAAQGHPWLFVALSGMAFLAWGEIFSLFPAITADIFGAGAVASIYGALYTAKGLAAQFVPYMDPHEGWANFLSQHLAVGRWIPVFGVPVLCDIAAAVLALFVLMPLRKQLR